jgi:hypothetical protein
MIKALSTLGLLTVIGIGAYIYSMNEQISDINEVCSLFPEGADVGDLREIENSYSVKLMGPFDVKDKPGRHQALFCAVLTMCDTSCWVEYQNNRVIKAEVSSL